MTEGVEVQRLSRDLYELSKAHMILASKTEAHIAGCFEQNKHVNASLARLELGQLANNTAFNRFVMLVLGAMAGVLLAIFAAWLATGGHHP